MTYAPPPQYMKHCNEKQLFCVYFSSKVGSHVSPMLKRKNLITLQRIGAQDDTRNNQHHHKRVGADVYFNMQYVVR